MEIFCSSKSRARASRGAFLQKQQDPGPHGCAAGLETGNRVEEAVPGPSSPPPTSSPTLPQPPRRHPRASERETGSEQRDRSPQRGNRTLWGFKFPPRNLPAPAVQQTAHSPSWGRGFRSETRPKTVPDHAGRKTPKSLAAARRRGPGRVVCDSCDQRPRKSARNLIPHRQRLGTSVSASPHVISLWIRFSKTSGAFLRAAQDNAPHGEIRACKSRICASEGARGALHAALRMLGP